MHEDLSELASVGFRHVVEDGLAILSGQAIPAARQQFVLEDLARIAEQAGEVSATPPASMFRSSDREAHLLFSLLIHRSTPPNVSWDEWLGRAARAFRGLMDGLAVTQEERDAARSFLQEVLGCIRALSILPGRTEREEGSAFVY